MSDIWSTIKDFSGTLAPLLLPICSVFAIAAFAVPWYYAIPALLVLSTPAAVVMWCRRSQLREVLGTLVTTKRGRLVLALTGLVVVVPPIVIFAAGEGRFVDAYEGWSWLLVWLAFGFWGVALVLRLPAFARGRWRRLFAAVFALAFARYYLWLFVGGPTGLGLIDHVAWLVLLAGLFVAAAVAKDPEPAEPVKTPQPPKKDWKLDHFGVIAALLAASMLTVAGVFGMASDPPVKHDDTRLDPVAAPVTPPPLPSAPADLAKTFAPVLELTDGQRWRPMRVDEYLADADLVDSRGRVVKPPRLTPSDLELTCSGGQNLCYHLTIHCSLDESTEQACEDEPEPDRSRGFAYARVVRKADLAGDAVTRDRLFPAVGPYREQLTAIVQYWLFYYYDDWKTRTIFGQMRQGHEADWEAVTIGFSDEEPLFVGLSAHCAGTWLPWKDVRIADARSAGSHPLVAVAEGSQANYDDASVDIPSNWLRCKGLGSHTLEVANLAYRIRDRTGDSTTLPLDVELFDKSDPEMDFPGWWGLHNVTWFETAFGRRYDVTEETKGPESPARKRDWLEPVSSIFCGSRWKYVGDGPRPRYPRC